jgi:drug/metabolite transporter (DMT)-like permease
MAGNEVKKWVVYSFMAAMLVIGTGNVFFMKGQNEVTSRGQFFIHPFLGVLFMFIAEFACLPIFLFLNRKNKLNPVEEGEKLNPFWYMVPSACDTLGSAFLLYGTAFVAASVQQMFSGGGMLAAVTFLSVIFLKTKYYRHHWTSLTVILLGMVLVVLATTVFTDQEMQTPTHWVGVMLLVLNVIFQATQMVVEQKLFSKYTIHALQAVGYEGLAGMLYLVILLPIFQVLPCKFMQRALDRGVPGEKGDDIFRGDCMPDENEPDHCTCQFLTMEDTVEALAQLGSSALLTTIVILMTISLCIFNWVGQSVTKYSSATARTTIMGLRTVLVWLIAFLIGWEKFVPLQLVGFIFLICGVIVFNEILEIPWFGFNRNTKSAIKKRQLGLPDSAEDKLKGKFKPEGEYQEVEDKPDDSSSDGD